MILPPDLQKLIFCFGFIASNSAFGIVGVIGFCQVLALAAGAVIALVAVALGAVALGAAALVVVATARADAS